MQCLCLISVLLQWSWQWLDGTIHLWFRLIEFVTKTSLILKICRHTTTSYYIPTGQRQLVYFLAANWETLHSGLHTLGDGWAPSVYALKFFQTSACLAALRGVFLIMPPISVINLGWTARRLLHLHAALDKTQSASLPRQRTDETQL